MTRDLFLGSHYNTAPLLVTSYNKLWICLGPPATCMTRDLYLRSHYNTAPFSHLLQQAWDLYGSSMCMTRDLYLRSHYNTAPFSHLLQQAVDLSGSSCYMYDTGPLFRVLRSQCTSICGLIITPHHLVTSYNKLWIYANLGIPSSRWTKRSAEKQLIRKLCWKVNKQRIIRSKTHLSIR